MMSEETVKQKICVTKALFVEIIKLTNSVFI